MADTPKPMEGIWTLIAPDGRTWQAESPLRVVAKEQRERVPANVALERIMSACDEAAIDPPEFREVSWGVDSVMRQIKGMAVREYAFREWCEAHGIALRSTK